MMINGKLQYVICNAGGFGTTTTPPNNAPVVNVNGQNATEATFPPNSFYDIPWRCMVPIRVENMLAAGRNISTDVYAQSGTRLIMACFTMGEVAGTAAAMSLANDLPFRKIDRIKLQQELIANHVNIGQAMRSIPGLASAAPYEEKYARAKPGERAVLDDSMKPFIGI